MPLPADRDVRPGAACAPEGALGYTSAGTMVRCILKPDEAHPHWRPA